MTRTLSRSEALELIQRGKVGRLGCVDRGEPYVVPINYLLEGESIYSHSLPGKKIDALRSNARACLQVDQIVDDFRWQSAIAFGSFEEIALPTERRKMIEKLLARFPNLTPVESMMVRDAASPDSIVFRIIIDRVTGVEEE